MIITVILLNKQFLHAAFFNYKYCNLIIKITALIISIVF